MKYNMTESIPTIFKEEKKIFRSFYNYFYISIYEYLNCLLSIIILFINHLDWQFQLCEFSILHQRVCCAVQQFSNLPHQMERFLNPVDLSHVSTG